MYIVSLVWQYLILCSNKVRVQSSDFLHKTKNRVNWQIFQSYRAGQKLLFLQSFVSAAGLHHKSVTLSNFYSQHKNHQRQSWASTVTANNNPKRSPWILQHCSLYQCTMMITHSSLSCINEGWDQIIRYDWICVVIVWIDVEIAKCGTWWHVYIVPSLVQTWFNWCIKLVCTVEQISLHFTLIIYFQWWSSWRWIMLHSRELSCTQNINR